MRHSIVLKRRSTAKPVAQPTVFRTQTRVAPAGLVKKQPKHAVVIAEKVDPGLAPHRPFQEKLDHAGAVRATIHIVADMNDGVGGAGARRKIAGDSVMDTPQQRKMTVNVADGVDAVRFSRHHPAA